MNRLDCKAARSLLMAYLDSELDTVSTVAVGEHLERCPECARRFAAEQALEQGLRARLEHEPMPAAVWERLQAGLREASRPRLLRWVPVAAAAVVLLALGLLLQQGLGEGPSERATPSRPLAELVAADHREQLARHVADAQADRARFATLEALLAGDDVPAALAGLDFPATGVLEHHPVELIGARHVELDGLPALNVRYECCGDPVSVYLVDRAALAEAPGAPAPTPIQADGLHGRTVVRGDVWVGVVSRHANPLEGHWLD